MGSADVHFEYADVKLLCRRPEVASDVISGEVDAMGRFLHVARFGDCSFFSVYAFHTILYGQTDG